MAMGIFKRSLLGAGFGAAAGGMSDEGSALGGAAGGALAAGPGMGLTRFFGGRSFAKRGMKGVSGILQGGAGFVERQAMRGASRLGDYGMRYGAQTGVATKGGIAAGFGQAAAGRFAMGAGTASQWIGQNAAQVNKWGGRALAGIGVASGAYIGSSVISSNRGY